MNKYRIVIAGIGGVGGYFGGKLALHFHASKDVEVLFLARGENLNAIQKYGLKVLDADSEFVAYPSIASDQAATIGQVDCIIIACKSYDLDLMLTQLAPCVKSDTLILPLLNGVNNRLRVEAAFPSTTVLDACVYIVSRLKSAGIIENQGKMQSIYFGLQNSTNEQIAYLETIFRTAHIDVHRPYSIESVVWEKFIFLSPIASITSCYDKSIGEILSDEKYLSQLLILIKEVTQLAHAKQIALPEDITERTLNKLKVLPFETSPSMRLDFKAKKPQTELDALTKFVIQEAAKYQIATPQYIHILSLIKQLEKEL